MTNHKDAKRLIAQNRYTIDDLMQIVAILRGEGGCPWDMEQTHASIRNDLIEETYEVVEAIDGQNPALLREELGDLLFQIAFHTQIEQEQGNLVLEDIISDVSAKMIHRHPHVFGSVEVSGTSEVLSNWDNIKTEEKQRNTLSDKLRAIPPMLPALMRAQKVAKKCGRFDDVTREDLCARMKQALEQLECGDAPEVAMGELLMNATAYAHQGGFSAEQVLSEETERLIRSVEEPL